MTDGATFNYGGKRYPLTTTTTRSLLKDADPVIYWALQFFSSVITTHIGPRLMMEVAAASAPITSAVQYVTPMDPVPWLQEEQFQFPLLALYRISEQHGYRTVNWSQKIAKLGIAYVLPPLTAGQAERICPILATIGEVISNRTEQGFDPGFMDGARVWSGAFSGLSHISAPVEGNIGFFPGVELPFPAWTGTITVNERQMVSTDLSAFVAADTHLDLTTVGDTTITDFVQVASDVVEPGPTTG